MSVSNEEAKRIHELCQAQGVEFDLEEITPITEGRLLIKLRGVVKDDQNTESVTGGTVPEKTIQEQLKEGTLKSNLQVPYPDDSIYAYPRQKASHMERTIKETQML